MFDINKIAKVDRVPIEKLIAYSPEQCPFRIYAYDKYHHEHYFCSLLSRDIEVGFWEQDDCFCTDKSWIEGCPLLKNSFTVKKN